MATKAELSALTSTQKVILTKEMSFRASIFAAAQNQGEATYKVVALLKGINWADTDRVNALRDEFYFGRLAAALKCDRETAKTVKGLIKHKDGANTDDRRTLEQERAYRAAVSGWSHVALLAGMPNKRSGATRTPRASSTNAAPVAVQNIGIDPASAVLAMDKAEKPDDVRVFALRVSELILAYENRNTAVLDADFRGVFDDYRAKVKALAETAEAPVAKPISAPIVNHGTAVPTTVAELVKRKGRK